MIYKYENKKIYRICECGTETSHDLGDSNLSYLEEFQQYENLSLQCENCGSTTVYNMNIPNKENDYLPDWVDQDERKQRALIRELKRDLINH